MTAANDLGLITAVPARIEVLTDARLKSIKLGNQLIRFKPAAEAITEAWPSLRTRCWGDIGWHDARLCQKSAYKLLTNPIRDLPHEPAVS